MMDWDTLLLEHVERAERARSDSDVSTERVPATTRTRQSPLGQAQADEASTAVLPDLNINVASDHARPAVPAVWADAHNVRSTTDNKENFRSSGLFQML
jgi:hypothetical protein